MNILKNHTAITNGVKTVFTAIGGTGPYTYSVLPGGAGGSINQDGIYTSPAFSDEPEDIIQAVDSLGVAKTSTISVMGVTELVCDIIATQLGLSSSQIRLYNQKIPIPKISGITVAVNVLSCKVFGSSSTFDASGTERQSTNMHSTIQIDIMSRSSEALNRKEEVILALGSLYAQSQMEANSFYIARIPSSFVNLSQDDGAAIPYRFNITVAIQYSVRKNNSVAYYDTFVLNQLESDN